MRKFPDKIQYIQAVALVVVAEVGDLLAHVIELIFLFLTHLLVMPVEAVR